MLMAAQLSHGNGRSGFVVATNKSEENVRYLTDQPPKIVVDCSKTRTLYWPVPVLPLRQVSGHWPQRVIPPPKRQKSS